MKVNQLNAQAKRPRRIFGSKKSIRLFSAATRIFK